MSSVKFWWDDSKSEDETDLDVRNLAHERRAIRDASNPLELSNEIFTKYFRVSKEVFVLLLNTLHLKMDQTVGSASVSPIIKLSAALRFFVEGGYQKGVGNDFNVGLSQPSISKALSAVVNIIEAEICPSAIKFPETEEGKSEIKLSFSEKTGFPGVIGCVDGTHIKIIPPIEDQHLYYNRKGYHRLNACDHNLVIRYVDANHPGSCHDSFAWNSSLLQEFLAEKSWAGERNTWILGDAGYPLKPYLITPFRTSNNWENYTFRCILGARQLHYKPAKATQIVNVCCALHNLRRKYNVNLEEGSQNQPQNTVERSNENDEESEENAERIRSEITNSFI